MATKLGSKVRDVHTGVAGMAVARTEWLYSGPSIGIEPSQLKDGLIQEIQWIDEVRIVTGEDEMPVDVGDEPTAEVSQLLNVIDRAAKSWLSLDPGVQWEGDVGDAMVAAVKEIEALRAAIKR